jgi:hypothetical protein
MQTSASMPLIVFLIIALGFMTGCQNISDTNSLIPKYPLPKSNVVSFNDWDWKLDYATPIGSEITVSSREVLYERVSLKSADSFQITEKFITKKNAKGAYFEIPKQILQPWFKYLGVIYYTYQGAVAFDEKNKDGRPISKEEKYLLPFRITAEGLISGTELTSFKSYDKAIYSLSRRHKITYSRLMQDHISFLYEISEEIKGQSKPVFSYDLYFTYNLKGEKNSYSPLPNAFEFIEYSENNGDDTGIEIPGLMSSKGKVKLRILRSFPCGSIYQVGDEGCSSEHVSVRDERLPSN